MPQAIAFAIADAILAATSSEAVAAGVGLVVYGAATAAVAAPRFQ